MKRLRSFFLIILVGMMLFSACAPAWDGVIDEPGTYLFNEVPGFEWKKDNPFERDEQENEPDRDKEDSGDLYVPLPPVEENPVELPRNTRSAGRTGLVYPQEMTNSSAKMKAIAETGVSFVRIEFLEEEVQLSDDKYDFTTNGHEDLVNNAVKEGLFIIGLLSYGPNPDLYDPDNSIAFLNLWNHYVQAVVDRFGDRIQYWEVGNEPNSLSFWQKVRPQDREVDVQAYAAMLRIAYNIIKEDDPRDVVIVGGLVADADFENGYSPSIFLKALANTIAKDSFDAVAFHPVWGAHLPEAKKNLWRSSQQPRNLYETMYEFIADARFYFKRDVPVYVTSMGLTRTWIDTLNQKMAIDPNWLELALMGRMFATLLAFPEVYAVLWLMDAPLGHGDRFMLSPYALGNMKQITQTLDQAWPLGFYPVQDRSGNKVDGAWQFRFELIDGTIVSWFWDEAETYEEVFAHLDGAPSGAKWHYYLDRPLSVDGKPVNLDEPFPLGSLPGLLIGDIEDDMVLRIDGFSGEPDLATIAIPWTWQSPDGIEFIYLTYDPSLWSEAAGGGSIDSLDSTVVDGCNISSRGYRDGQFNYTFTTEKVRVGNTDFGLTSEVDPSGKIDLQHIDWSTVGLSIRTGSDQERCTKEVWEVIRLSEKNGFGLGLQDAPESRLESVEMVIDGFSLSFDPALWKAIGGAGNYYLERLEHPACQIHYQLGHGIDPTIYSYESFELKIGDIIMDVGRWTENVSGYYLGEAYNFDYIDGHHQIMAYLGMDEYSEDCLQRVREVVNASEANNFGITPRTNEPTIMTADMGMMNLGGPNLYVSYDTEQWNTFSWGIGSRPDLVHRHIPNCRFTPSWTVCNHNDNLHYQEIRRENFAGKSIEVVYCTAKGSNEFVAKGYNIEKAGSTWNLFGQGYLYDSRQEVPISDSCVQAADRLISLSAYKDFQESP